LSASSSEESETSSNSNSGSGGGVLHHWYGQRRRAGVKMGVCQRHHRSSCYSHSDPDCNVSSSEQSCDTAIFVGSRSRAPPPAAAALGDREPTAADSENAAASVVAVRRTHSKVCRAFSVFTLRNSVNISTT